MYRLTKCLFLIKTNKKKNIQFRELGLYEFLDTHDDIQKSKYINGFLVLSFKFGINLVVEYGRRW